MSFDIEGDSLKEYKEENDKRIGQRNKKSRYAVVYECSLLRLVALVYVLGRIGTIAVYAEQQQHHAAAYLQQKTVALIADNVHHETHAKTREQCIYNVAYASADACDKSIPAPLVECALYAKHSDRSHWRRSHDAYEYSFEYKV